MKLSLIPDFITFLRYLMAQKSDEVRKWLISGCKYSKMIFILQVMLQNVY